MSGIIPPFVGRRHNQPALRREVEGVARVGAAPRRAGDEQLEDGALAVVVCQVEQVVHRAARVVGPLLAAEGGDPVDHADQDGVHGEAFHELGEAVAQCVRAEGLELVAGAAGADEAEVDGGEGVEDLGDKAAEHALGAAEWVLWGGVRAAEEVDWEGRIGVIEAGDHGGA